MHLLLQTVLGLYYWRIHIAIGSVACLTLVRRRVGMHAFKRLAN